MKAKNNHNYNSSLIAIFISVALLLLVSWGMNNTAVALFLIEHPVLILPYLLEKLVEEFGSPGTGKTQAISQMTTTLRERSDFRAMIFDRSGEMLEKFYDPTKDIIFNPFDARSIAWSHTMEAARPQTMAAALIPRESEKEPFFSNAGRVVMAELFRQTKSNHEL